jgi:hypothetical protein
VGYKASRRRIPQKEGSLADSVRFKDSVTLKAQANLGEEVEDFEFEAGAELQVLQTWENAYLVKNDDGRLFNVKKELVEEA